MSFLKILSLFAIICILPLSAFAESTITMQTDRTHYERNHIVYVSGQVNIVDDKVVGLDIPKGLNVSLEIFDSRNQLSTVLTEKSDDNGKFFFEIHLNQLSTSDKYKLVAYYGIANRELMNTQYSATSHIFIGSPSTPTPQQNTPVPQAPVPQNNPTVTPPPSQDSDFNWTMVLGFVIVGVVIGVPIIRKLGLLSFGSGGYSALYECEMCGRTFQHLADYKQHQQTHGEPHFKCNICGRRFYKQENLMTHVKHDHSSKPPKPQTRPRRELTESDLRNDFKRYNWRDLEQIVGTLFKKKGYRSFVTKGSNDKGIDVEAKRGNSELTKIQVKFWKGDVGRPELQSLVGSSITATQAIMISVKSGFTKSAKDYAFNTEAKYKLKIWGREKFHEEIRKQMQNGIFFVDNLNE